MAIYLRQDENYEALRNVAERMAIAARTAPKTRGKDVIQIAIVDGDELMALADDMGKIAEEFDMAFFARDAGNLRNSQLAVLIGCEIKVNNLNPCGMCGFPDCATKSKHPEIPCVFNTMDMGIAIGSAVSVAADARVDNRTMYTIGQAAKRLGMLEDSVPVVCGIPISAQSKNPYFDRKKK
ncbi:MAG: DUF2148 domain-containing protein [Bacteroidales bacterium]|jgi:uncharacterized ferredoxin-like protein|nr:DUF2148 domain-containing protein [Bacteroidales bacterium]